MRRGFKAEAERCAKTVRKEMGLRPADPLDAMQLAAHVGADVRSADELISRAKLDELERLQPGAFSACTFTIGDRHVVVYSPLASPGRRQSDISHEVAHLLLDHEMKSVEKIGGVSFFTCDSEEEQEANWLAGCLLLPREAVMAAAHKGLDAAGIGALYDVSAQMAAFRLRTTGVLRQLKATGQHR
jgi:hypothetical protein